MKGLSDIVIGTKTLDEILIAIVIFIVGLIILKILLTLFDRAFENSKIDQTVKGFIRSIVKFGLLIVIIAVTLDGVGVDPASIIAVLGVAGLALSLALQDLLANLFSGLTLLTTKPFIANDYVEVDDKSGIVESIDLFYTKLKTFDNKIIFVPNGKVTSGNIVNYTTQVLRRVDITVGASYDAATQTVRKAIMEAISENHKTLDEPKPVVFLENYGDNAIDYVMRVWVKSEDYWEVHYALNENIREKFDKYSIEFTYPHVNVHMMDK